jgi:hypothetical protein
MKTMILITTPFGLENNIPDIKRRIVEYVGSRLIKNNPDNVPLIELNCLIDKTDKEMISKLSEEVLETAVLIVVETDDDQFGRESGNMCILEPVV